MAKTDDFELCRQYLLNYVESIKQELHTYERKLLEQTDLYPITEVSLEKLDYHLKEFVNRERNYVIKRNTYKLEKFKGNIQNTQSLSIITADSSTINQVCLYIDNCFYFNDLLLLLFFFHPYL
jgi:hypothetical protein